MSFDNPPFSIRRGDDGLVNVDVFDRDGKPVDLTAPGTLVVLTYGMGGGLRGPATKRVTQDQLFVSGNRATYRMPPAETLALRSGRSYWIRCRVTFPDGTVDGFRDTVTTGSFSVEQTSDPSDDD